MPRRVQHRRRTNIFLGPFELAIVRFVEASTSLTMGEQIREALRPYARHHPSFNPERFRAFVESAFLPQLSTAAERDATRQALEVFLANEPPPDLAPPRDFHSDSSHFEFELPPPKPKKPKESVQFFSSHQDFDVE